MYQRLVVPAVAETRYMYTLAEDDPRFTLDRLAPLQPCAITPLTDTLASLSAAEAYGLLALESLAVQAAVLGCKAWPWATGFLALCSDAHRAGLAHITVEQSTSLMEFVLKTLASRLSRRVSVTGY